MMNRNTGVRWQSWSDKAMQSLAEQRACDDRPDLSLDEVWRRHDGSVNVEFGSTPATVTFGNVDWEVRSLFLHGYCSLFAYMAAVRLGFEQFVLITSSKATEGRWSGHVGVLLPDGRVLDVEGSKPFDTFGDGVIREIASKAVIGMEEMLDVIFAGEFRNDPLGFIEELEQFLLSSWVDAVVREAGIQVPSFA